MLSNPISPEDRTRRGVHLSKLSVIIPAYNEEASIRPLYHELKTVLNSMGTPHEIIFVDDGSTDTTFSELMILHAKDPSLHIIQFRKNFGQSAAMKAGFDHAGGDFLVTLDADLQNDPGDIPQLLEKLETEDYDVVCGWRFNRNDPFLKRIFSKFANRIRRMMTGETIHDSGCTLRVYRKECAEDLELYGELHRYIPALLAWKGFRVGEMETNHRERKLGTSKYNWKRLVKGFLDLIVVTFWKKYAYRPIHVMGGSGIVIGMIGLFLFLYLTIERLLFNVPLSDRPLFIVSILCIIIGVQFIVFGILADIMLKTYYGMQGRKTYLIHRIIE